MKLVKVKNAGRQPRSTLNIEVAHVAVDGSNYLKRLELAFEASAKVEKDLQFDRYNFRTVRSLLVDEKRKQSLDREEWFAQVSREFPSYLKQIDYVAFESDLKNSLNSFYSRIRPDKQSSVKNNFERYLAKRKKTGCSHDIALWHSMRLGVLGRLALPIYEIVSGDAPEKGLRGSFLATNVCSILPVSDRNFEEDAETEILRHIDSRHGDWRKIKRYYYEA